MTCREKNWLKIIILKGFLSKNL